MLKIEHISGIYDYRTERKSWRSIPDRKVHTVAYQIEGHYTHDFRFGRIEVVPDTLFIIDRKDDYSVRCREPGHAVCLTFEGELPDGTIAVDCRNYPVVRGLFRKLLMLKNMKNDRECYEVLSLLYRIFAFAETEKEAADGDSGIGGTVRLIAERINEAYNETTCDPYGYAAQCGLKERRFRDHFKKIYGTTPTVYLTDIRLSAAANLLSDGGLGISDIAEMCGFSDVYYFSRLFKNHFGMSPAKYRGVR